MNKFIYFFFLLSLLVYGQKSSLKVGSNPYTINSSAVMEIESTTKGFLPPRMTLAQRNEITPIDGLIIYCTDCTAGKKMQYYSDSGWDSFSIPNSDYVYDRKYGDGVHDFVYKPVIIPMVNSNSSAVATWLNFNLGANYANENDPAFNPDATPTSYQDSNAYGSLFQWGRAADGHELINWASGTSGTLLNGTSNIRSTTDIPNNGGKFITNTLTNTNNDDWRTPQNNTLWQGVNGINNPCPNGYRLPTRDELDKAFYFFNTILPGFSSSLKLPAAGNIQINGQFAGVSAYSYTWTSTVADIYAINTYLDSSTKYINPYFKRGNGASVRCIKE